MLDDLDRRILRQWQADPSLSPAEIGERAGLSAAQVTRRIARMEDQGIIRAVETDIDWRALGYEVEVSLRVNLDKTVPGAFDQFIDAARQVPEVLEIQTFLGQVDVRLAIIVRDLEHYQHLYRERILTLPHIADIEALMHVARVKAQEALPL